MDLRTYFLLFPWASNRYLKKDIDIPWDSVNPGKAILSPSVLHRYPPYRPGT